MLHIRQEKKIIGFYYKITRISIRFNLQCFQWKRMIPDILLLTYYCVDMASLERIARLNELVELAGNTRKAEMLIKKVVGVAPSHSAIHKAMQKTSKTTDYVVQSYINNLEFAIKSKVNTNLQSNKMRFRDAVSSI